MRWSDIPRNPDARTLRQFGVLGLFVFGSLAAWRFAAHGGASPVVVAFGVAAVVLGAFGLLAPRLLRPVFVGWLMLAFPIGWTISNLVLALMYYGMITPLGLVFRLLRRDALALRPPRDASSYWQPKPMPVDVRRYFRQY
jgi:hypothetical protein